MMKKRAVSLLLCLMMVLTLLVDGMPAFAESRLEQPTAKEAINESTESSAPTATPGEAEPDNNPSEEAEVPDKETTVSTPSDAALQETPQAEEELPLETDPITTDAYESYIDLAAAQDEFYGGEIFTLYNTVSVSGNQTVLEEGSYTVISIPKDSFQKPTAADVSTEFDCFKDLEIQETEDSYLIITTYKTVYGGYTGGTPVRLSLLPRQVVNQQSYEIRQIFYDKNGEPLTPDSVVAVKAKAKIETLSSNVYGTVQLAAEVDENYIIRAGTEIKFYTSYISPSSNANDPRDRRVYAAIPEGAKVKEGTGWTLDTGSGKYYKDVPRDQWRNPSIILDLGGINMSEFDSAEKSKEFRVVFSVQPVVDGVPQDDLGPYSSYCSRPYYILKGGKPDPGASFSFSTREYTKTIGPDYKAVAGQSTFESYLATTTISYNQNLLGTQRIRYSHKNIRKGDFYNSQGDEETRELILRHSRVDANQYTSPSEVRIVLMGLPADRIDAVKEKLAGTKAYGIAAGGSRTLLLDDVPVVSYASYRDSFTADGWTDIPGGEAYKTIEFEYPNGGVVLRGQEEINAVKDKIWTEVTADLKPELFTALKSKLDRQQSPQVSVSDYAAVGFTVKYQKFPGDVEQTSFDSSARDYVSNTFRMQYETISRKNSINVTNGSHFFIGDAVRTELAYTHSRQGNFSEPTMPENANLYYLVPDGLEPVSNPEQFAEIKVIRGYRDGYNLVVAKPKTMKIPKLGDGSISADAQNSYVLGFTATDRLEVGSYTIHAALAIDNNKIGVGADGQQYGILQFDTPSGLWMDILKDAKNRPGNNTKFTDLYKATFRIYPPYVLTGIKEVKLSEEADSRYASSLGERATIGERIDYRWRLKNNSKKPIDSLTIIDILPFRGDQSIVANDAGEYPSRGSCFRTPLLSVEDNEKFDIYYSTDTVKTTTQENNGASWSQAVKDMSKVTMIKAVLKPGQTIHIDESCSIITHHQIENNNQIQDGEKAYNSFAISTNEGNSFWEVLRTEVRVTYPKQDVILEKTDAKDPAKKLHKAVFSLYEEGSDRLIRKDITTNHDGLATLPDLLIGKTYYLLETAAPQGYEKSDQKIIFTVSEQAADVDVQEIIVTNTSEGGDPPNPPAEHTGDLTVTKTVSGSGGNRNKEFRFTVTLDKKDMDGQYGDMNFTNGVAVFTLKHGQSKTAADLPAGVSYSVEESDSSGYTVTKTNPQGTIQRDVTAVAAFENYKGSSGGGDGGDGGGHTPKKARVNLTASKTLNGQAPAGSGFTFFLEDAAGHRLQAKNNQGGNILFDTLSFDRTGSYVYYLTEQAGEDKEINYDTASYKVTVTVTRAHDYEASVAYEKDGQAYYGVPSFANTTTIMPGPETPGTVPPAPQPVPQHSLDQIPKTSDTSHLGLWGILAAFSALSLVTWILAGKRRRSHARGKRIQ